MRSDRASRMAIAGAMLMAMAMPVAAQAQAAPQVPAPYVKDPRNWPTPVVDTVPPTLPAFKARHAVLVLSKTNGFRDDPQIRTANAALAALVRARGWDVFVTENAAVSNPAQLAKFDVIVLNSTSGDIFTEAQRAAFRGWLERGGGLVALHGAGGDHDYAWKWYQESLIGAVFMGHTARPKQFQQGTIHLAEPGHPILKGLPAAWTREEEWYAFDRVPSGAQTRILAWLDEDSYEPVPNQRMGAQHPIMWTRCIGRGRMVFSALGHKAETYGEPLHLRMIGNALDWAAVAKRQRC
ncbi:ThuA domain-containing protein [Sphingomonas hengshuiensis]|nr:ThuA domain-containing protein [Sphingomonas hengshuiensis]